MHALDEKNALTQELDKARKLAEELHQEKQDVLKELSKTRLEIENYKRQLLQQVGMSWMKCCLARSSLIMIINSFRKSPLIYNKQKL